MVFFVILINVFPLYSRSCQLRGVKIRLQDWATVSSDPDLQKKMFTEILNKLDEANFNAVFVEIQKDGAVAWQSKHQPVVSFLDNGQGELKFDVPAFVYIECLKRHIDCHFMITPTQIGIFSTPLLYRNAPVKHPFESRRELCVISGDKLFIDPGHSASQNYFSQLYSELLERYDMDGLIVEGLGYDPFEAFDDSGSFSENNPAGMAKDKWRRANLSNTVETIHKVAATMNPYIRVSAECAGTYKNDPLYYNPTAYSTYLQDPGMWAQKGSVDFIIPFMTQTDGSFNRDLNNWGIMIPGRKIAVELDATIFFGGGTKKSNLKKQIKAVVENSNVYGLIFNGVSHITDNSIQSVEFYDYLKNEIFKTPSHIPGLPHLSSYPLSPETVEHRRYGNLYEIKWCTPKSYPGEIPVRYFSVYRLLDGRLDTDNPKCWVSPKISSLYVITEAITENDRFVVTTVDRFNNESLASESSSACRIQEIEDYEFDYRNFTIEIKVGRGEAEIEIYSSTGIKTMAMKSSGGYLSENISSLEKGVYFIVIQTISSKYAEKIIR